MAHLVRAAILVNEVQVDREVLQQFARLAQEIADATARDHFDEAVQINLTLGEGSLKVAAAVVGAIISSTYYFVGNYKAFKEGVAEICKDANEFGDDFCDRFLKAAGIKKAQVRTKRVQVQTPAQLKDLLEEVEKIAAARSAGDFHIEHRLAGAAWRLDRVLSDLSGPEQAVLTQQLTTRYLPPPEQWPRERRLSANVPKLARPAEPPRIEDRTASAKPRKPKKLRVTRRVRVNPKERD